jgi:hypothetical protein
MECSLSPDVGLNETMATTVAPHMPSAGAIVACRWLPDSELAVYSGEYESTVTRSNRRYIARVLLVSSFSPAHPLKSSLSGN